LEDAPIHEESQDVDENIQSIQDTEELQESENQGSDDQYEQDSEVEAPKEVVVKYKTTPMEL
jgi:hypothetical protein